MKLALMYLLFEALIPASHAIFAEKGGELHFP